MTNLLHLSFNDKLPKVLKPRQPHKSKLKEKLKSLFNIKNSTPLPIPKEKIKGKRPIRTPKPLYLL